MMKAGFAASNSEARRLVQQGGVELDQTRLADPKADVQPADGAILRVGKSPLRADTSGLRPVILAVRSGQPASGGPAAMRSNA